MRRTMHKILYVDSSAGIFGGGQVSLLELLRNLDKSRFCPRVALPERKRLAEEVARLGIEYHLMELPTLKTLNIIRPVKSLARLVRFLKGGEIELIHTNTPRAAIYGGIAGRLVGIPMVLHARIPLAGGILDRFLASLATKVIVVSQAVAQRYKWLPPKKTALIYNGVDLARFRPGPREEGIRDRYGITGEEVAIGMVGRFSPEKGHTVLVSALASVIPADQKVKVLLVGNKDNVWAQELEEEIEKKGLGAHFVFTGFAEDIPGLMRALDIFCLPSLSEGFSRALLEAMACGLPAIATEVGGNAEIVQDGKNGILVPCQDSGALAQAIVQLLRDPELRATLGRAAHQTVEKGFSSTVNARRTEAVYEEILAGE